MNEIIEVIAYFNAGKLSPLRFKWRGRVYDNLKLDLAHAGGVNDDKRYYFHVSDRSNSFRLVFMPTDMSWILETLYFDG